MTETNKMAETNKTNKTNKMSETNKTNKMSETNKTNKMTKTNKMNKANKMSKMNKMTNWGDKNHNSKKTTEIIQPTETNYNQPTTRKKRYLHKKNKRLPTAERVWDSSIPRGVRPKFPIA